jgi:hypothetical protein
MLYLGAMRINLLGISSLGTVYTVILQSRIPRVVDLLRSGPGISKAIGEALLRVSA